MNLKSEYFLFANKNDSFWVLKIYIFYVFSGDRFPIVGYVLLAAMFIAHIGATAAITTELLSILQLMSQII